MKITFVLPEIVLTGGVKAVFEFANNLHKWGHKVFVVYPFIPMRSVAKWYNLKKLVSQIKRSIKNFKRGNRVGSFDLKANLIRVPTLAERFIPDADIIVATWWETAYYVSRYGKSKGEKFYLAQHYEIWGGPEEKVNNSYKLGLRIIVNSTWLKNILQNKLNVPVESLILHAPDWNQFYPERIERSDNTIKILIPCRKEKWKGLEDGIKAFEIAKASYPNIQLVMFGPVLSKNVPEYVEFHKYPDNDKLRKIYNSSDIFVFPSWYEGFGMPPMEAMACGIACVTTNVGAIPDCTIPGETALVSEPRDIKGLAQNIITLTEDENLRKKIAESGHNYIKQFTWEKATDKLEEVLKKYI